MVFPAAHYTNHGSIISEKYAQVIKDKTIAISNKESRTARRVANGNPADAMKPAVALVCLFAAHLL